MRNYFDMMGFPRDALQF